MGYCGLGTKDNRIRWGISIAFTVALVICLIASIALYNSCKSAPPSILLHVAWLMHSVDRRLLL
jgi:hypothetical protein